MHAASILIYIPSGNSIAAATYAPKLQSFLKKAGHKPRVVQGTDGLGGALSSGQYDLVLTDLADVASLQKQIENSSSKPSVVPIAIKATKAEQAAAKKQYKCLVKNSNDGDDFLDAIEEAMRNRTSKKSSRT
jgi:DNA-binding NtrC family response regulator